MELRIVFFGTPDFAVPSLEGLIESGAEVAAVITQPDRPGGRGQQFQMSPVKQGAMRFGLRVEQPPRLNRPEVIEFLRGLGAEAMAVVAYGKIIPQSIIDIPRLGVVNLHSSLLPAYRGAAPIQWAIANGESRTGVTTMLIDAGLDTGDILLEREVEIGPEETSIELSRRLATMGAGLLAETLLRLKEGRIEPRKQDHERATLAPMLTKEDGRIDWSWTASKIHNRVRGFQPWPGAYTTFRGQSLHIWRSRIAAGFVTGPPGTLRGERRRLFAACGGGTSIELLEVQVEGRRRLCAEAFLNGQHLAENERLGEETS